MSFRVLILVLFLTLPADWAVAAQDVWKGVGRIVAIGDVHGDYDQFVALLDSAGLINANHDWTGGKTHLVQTGDVLDRGPQSRKVMDLLMRLEVQARKAGGYVHALIGNHEAMNIYGDHRYVSPQEYAAFRDEKSEKTRDHFYKQHIKELKGSPPPERKEWESRHPLGYFEHRYHFGPNGKYGKWIRRHNTVIKINDTIFLHGGISPKYANHSIRRINDRVRKELKDMRKLRGGIVTDEEGPLWYRGLARTAEKDLESHLETVLSNYGCERIVVAHAKVPGAVMPRFGGRVILIEVGMSAPNGGRLACLLIEKNRAYALHRGKKLELPKDSGTGLLNYLKRAAALDPAPSPLQATIRQLEAQLAVPAANQ